MEIKKVVIIGSGTMGSGIAAQLCNANVPVTLLDLKTEISEKARERILKSRPPLLIDKSKINNIKVGNINDDFNTVKDADWVVEAVVERIDIKHNIYEKIFKNRKPGAIVSSNTSSIPIKILSQNLSDEEFNIKNIKLDKEVLDILISGCGGDIRKAIDTYELAVMSIDSSKNKIVSKDLIKELLENNSIYDKQSDNHYNNISAFIKSIRGSDPDAAIYYLARMLKNGEDPLFIARRLIISASEDIGLANPNAMIIANSTFESVNKIGMPEGRIPLANATIYLSLSEKSNSSYKAINEAYEEVSNNPITEVPIHLMNAETKIDEEFGVGKGYEYDHNSEDGFIKQDNFPKKLSNRKFYNPIGRGIEKTLKDRFEKLWLKD